MTNTPLTHDQMRLKPVVIGRRSLVGHGAVILAVFLAMACWTWGTWCDPLVDFGRELYVPWQIIQGKVLYRDIAYFNGPLSAYFNALVFEAMGVGLRWIVIANLLILTGLTCLIWRLWSLTADRFTATVACIVLLSVFAFIQLTSIGNYNWVTPYSHEITHGIFLSFAGILCLATASRPNECTPAKRFFGLGAAGLLLGLVFLTKAEVFLAAAVALAAGAIAAIRAWRLPKVKSLGLLVLWAMIAPLVAFLLLWRAMPASRALRGVCGSWVYVMDPGITGMRFYRQILGALHPQANLIAILETTAIYLLVLGPLFLLGWCARGRTATQIAIAVTSLAALVAFWIVDPQWWQDAFRGFTIALGAIAAASVVHCWRRREAAESADIARLTISVFALFLLAKMALNVRVAQYGFALAMPAMLVFIAALLQFIPRMVDARGGSGAIFRAAAVPLVGLIIAVHLRPYAMLFSDKPLTVARGTDEFRADAVRGAAVNKMVDALDALPAHQTLATIPEGVMLNYLSRRTNPSGYNNLMPPEVMMFGEANILAAYQAHPPDCIVLVLRSDPTDYGYKAFGTDYGKSILQWIRHNYAQTSAPTEPEYPLLLLRRKSPGADDE